MKQDEKRYFEIIEKAKEPIIKKVVYFGISFLAIGVISIFIKSLIGLTITTILGVLAVCYFVKLMSYKDKEEALKELFEICSIGETKKVNLTDYWANLPREKEFLSGILYACSQGREFTVRLGKHFENEEKIIVIIEAEGVECIKSYFSCLEEDYAKELTLFLKETYKEE